MPAIFAVHTYDLMKYICVYLAKIIPASGIEDFIDYLKNIRLRQNADTEMTNAPCSFQDRFQVWPSQLLEAFDKYYADNIVMTEPRGTREGKQVCRDYEIQFLNSVEAFHGLDVHSIGSDESNGTTFVESSMEVTFKGGPRVNMRQVAVQKWEGDQIVREEFYYDNAN